ncbi:MAG: hypothetical protein QN158_04405 [Armatimonadota bacterium]|nr:hypothetical protein [Armatimonadota bacterium]
MSTSLNASTHARHAAPLDAAGQRSTGVRFSAAAMLDAVARLSDTDLLEQVSALAAREREATTALVAHLAELDARRLYLARGCASLFTYCTEVLRLSEHAAYHRIQAARAAHRFPLLLDLLASGALTLTTVTLLAPHLTPANHQAVLRAAAGRSKREVEALVATLHPQPPVPTVLRRLPAPRSIASGTSLGAAPPLQTPGPAEATTQRGQPSGADSADASGAATTGILKPQREHPQSTTSPRPSHRPLVQPLAPGRYKVQFTASAATVAKLRQAQDLLRHQIPDGDLAQVIDRALTALLQQVARRRTGAAARPREPGPAREAGARSVGARPTAPAKRPTAPAKRPTAPAKRPAAPVRSIPASVRRTVWVRDGGRCAFVAPDGRRCSETAFLEFHHLQPVARGGRSTVANLELRCRAHNGYEAQVAGLAQRWSTVRRDGTEGSAEEPNGTRPGPSWSLHRRHPAADAVATTGHPPPGVGHPVLR